MSALTEFLFPAPAKRSVRSIVGWWEGRRLAYNAIVGATGIVSLALINVFAILPPALDRGEGMPLLFPLAYGVMANVCYFFGPITEIVVEKLWGRQLLPTGPTLFRAGLTFSVGLTLLPALLFAFSWVARVVIAVF